MHRILFLLLFYPSILFSQVWEIGLQGGIISSKGDINTRFDIKNINSSTGGFIRKNITPRWSIRGNFWTGKTQGSDDLNKGWRQNRNLSFETKIEEASLLFEFNFLPFVNGVRGKNFTPYLYSGFTVFHFNPKSTVNNTEYDLQEYGTEGQGSVYYLDRNNYFLVNFAIPIGGGLKVGLSKNLSLGIDISTRKTFTDYLDDVSSTYPERELIEQQKGGKTIWALSDNSIAKNNVTGNSNRQRGNSKDKDWYSFLGISLTYVFWSDQCARAFDIGYKWDQ